MIITLFPCRFPTDSAETYPSASGAWLNSWGNNQSHLRVKQDFGNDKWIVVHTCCVCIFFFTMTVSNQQLLVLSVWRICVQNLDLVICSVPDNIDLRLAAAEGFSFFTYIIWLVFNWFLAIKPYLAVFVCTQYYATKSTICSSFFSAQYMF